MEWFGELRKLKKIKKKIEWNEMDKIDTPKGKSTFRL